MRYFKILIVSILIFGNHRSGNTCGPDYTPTPRFIFNPNLTGTADLSEYWYDPSSYLNAIVMPDTSIDAQSAWKTNVVNDWYLYTNKSVSKEDITNELFGETEPEDKKLYKWLQAKKGGQEYYNLMMQISTVLAEPTGWNDIAWTYKTAQNQYGIELNAALIQELDAKLSALQQQTDGYLTLRCAYQRLKIYHYSNQTEKAKKIFETYFAGTEKNWFYYSAAFYNALSYEGIEEAKYLLQCLRNGVDKKNRIIYIFNLELYDSLMQEPLTTEMRNDLMALCSMRNPEMNSITALDSIIATEPNHPFVALLISRELAKLEDAALNYNQIFSDYESYKYYIKPLYRNPVIIAQYYDNIRTLSGKLKQLLGHIKTEIKTEVPNWINIIDAYTTVLEGNHNAFLIEFENLKNKRLTQRELLQLQAIELVSYGFRGELHGKTFENKAISFFTQLNAAEKDGFHAQMAAALLKHLGWMYHAHGDFESGTLLRKIYSSIYDYSDADDLDMAMSDKNYSNMIDIITNPDKIPFIYHMLHNNFKNIEIVAPEKEYLLREVYSAQMRWYMRRGMLENASETYTKMVGNGKDEWMVRNPFFVNYAGSYGWSDSENEMLSLTEMFKIMKVLNVKLKQAKGNEYSKIALLLGNAYLSMSNRGANSSLMYSYSTEYPMFNNYPEDIMGYVTGKMAAEFFDKAWQNCTDENLGAVILIQKGACKTKSDDAFSIMNDDWDTQLWHYKSMQNPYESDYVSRFGKREKLHMFTSNCDNIRLMYKNLERYTRLPN